MRSRIITVACAVALSLVGCGGGKTSTTTPDDPDPVVVKPAPPPDACAETAALLDDTDRLAVDAALDADGIRAARAEYLALVTEACRSHGWPTVVIDCIRNAASHDELPACTGQLPGAAKRALANLLAGWRRDHSAGADQRKAPPIACTDLGEHAKHWAIPPADPALAGYAVTVLRTEVARRCAGEDWSKELRACVAAAVGPAAVIACKATGFDEALELAAVRITRVGQNLEQPRRIECQKVVDRHYGDDAWAGAVPRITGKARAKLITAARKRMLAVCKAKKWEPVLRACVVSEARATDRAACLDQPAEWGIPPADVVTTTGVKECDEYLAAKEVRQTGCDGADVAALRRAIADERLALASARADEDLVARCTALATTLTPCAR